MSNPGHSASLSLGSAAAFQAAQRDAGSASPSLYQQQQQAPQPQGPVPQPQAPNVVGQPGPQDAGAPASAGGPPQREGQTRRGVCKFFNSQKGFGFVLDSKAEELGGQEVFVHFTAIQSKTGFRSLAEGEEVEYEITTGPKGFQAVRLTGPGGRPVIGDPKARLMKNPPFMQLAPIAFPPYAMDPYAQQHPGAMYAASPYTQHVVYVPQAVPPQQQAQYAQMMGNNGNAPQFSPQVAGGFGAASPAGPGAGPNGRQALMAQQQAQQGMASTNPGVPGFQQQQPGAFGAVAPQPGNSPGFANPAPRYGGAGGAGGPGFGNLGMGGANSPNNAVFGNSSLGLNPNRSDDGAGAPSSSSAFFGSGNLLYSSN